MSADNWAECPRCIRRAQAALAEQNETLRKAYQTLPMEEFVRLSAELKAKAEVLRPDRRTFREDYEFYGAEDGAVRVSYRGECTVCGLFLSIEESHPIPGVDQ